MVITFCRVFFSLVGLVHIAHITQIFLQPPIDVLLLLNVRDTTAVYERSRKQVTAMKKTVCGDRYFCAYTSSRLKCT